MSSLHALRGVTIPTVGEDILPTLSEMVRTSGTIRTAASVAAARSVLTAAQAAGVGPTTTAPAYFDIGGVIYRADGTTSAGVWALTPVSENEGHVGTFTPSGTITRTPGSQHALITSALPARPYDRYVSATGMVNASVAGTVGLRILILNTGGATSRWETGASLQTQVAINAGIVPAGADPQVILALAFGGSSNSTVTVSAGADANRLLVQAQPITMS